MVRNEAELIGSLTDRMLGTGGIDKSQRHRKFLVQRTTEKMELLSTEMERLLKE